MIKNNISGKCYYGSTINWIKRKNEHINKLRNNKHNNPHLLAAWKKYGENAFDFIWIKDVCCALLLSTEQLYIDSNNGGYNIALYASAPMRGRKHSDETKNKISAALLTEEIRKKLSSCAGKKLSNEHKNKLSIVSMGVAKSTQHRQNISIGRRGIKFSKEHLKNLSISHQKPESKCYVWQPKTNKFRVRIRHNGKRYSGGCFNTEIEAAIAVQRLREKLKGEL